MSKHTAGPWKIGRQNRHDAWIHNEAGETVAYVHNATGYRPDCSDDPNARLISAAPDQHAALLTVSEGVTTIIDNWADWTDEQKREHLFGLQMVAQGAYDKAETR